MKHVDVTGEICPRPALIVRRELSEMKPGDQLLVRGDYPPAKQNLQRTCTKHGFEVGESSDDEGTEAFELRITVTENTSTANTNRNE
jgi:tRNA 2-thiouridine synthesizing protein A